MTKQVKSRRGTAAEHAAFTGAVAELTVDTTNNRVRVHDGVTAGGFEVGIQTGAQIKTLYEAEASAFTDAQFTKLAGVEALADVTDATNVAAALTNGVAALTAGEVTQLANIGTEAISAAEWGYVAAATAAFTSVLETKIDGIEALADVTDATNVTAAGALMDSEVTNLAEVKAFSAADYATAAQGTLATNALPKAGGALTGAVTTTSTFDGRDVSVDGTKLDGIEALADVTDVTNVTAAGALMDSELAGIAAVKALNQGVATTDSPTFAGIDVTGTVTADGLTVDGDLSVSAANSRIRLYETDTIDLNTQLQNQAGDFNIARLDDDAGNSTVQLNIDHATGNVSIPNGNLDVTGTVTADGLTVSAAAAAANITSTSGGATLNLTHPTATSGYSIRQGNADANDFRIFEGSKIKLNITTGGNISFYEATGTTPKFYWSASAERLGIGNSSPTTALDVTGTVTADGLTVDGDARLDGGSSGSDTYLRFTESFAAIQNAGFYLHLDGTDDDLYIGRHDTADTNVANDKPVIGIDRGTGDISFYEDTGTTPKMVWKSADERLGIGTSSPTAPLTILSTGWEHLSLKSSDVNATNKTGYVTVGHYTNAQESFGLISGQSTTSSNILNLGGGAAGLNTATSINLYTAANNTTVTGTSRLSIDSSGNVGIGTSSPDTILHTYGTSATVYNPASVGGQDTSATLRIQNYSNAADTFAAIDFNTNLGRVVNRIVSGHASSTTSGFLGFVTEDGGVPAERMRITSTGDLSLTGGGGIIFTDAGGTGTATSNTLDDYEEGTWTPVAADDVSGGNESPTTGYGYYVKVGQLVYVQFNISNIDTTGLTSGNNIYFTGLPFATKSVTGNAKYTGTAHMSLVTFSGSPMLNVSETQTALSILEVNSGAGSDSVIVSELVSGSSDVHGNLCYQTA